MDAKHQFKYTYNETVIEDYSPHEITFEMPGDATLDQILYNFESYLKACGFVFDGTLQIVDETLDAIDDLDGTLYDIDKQEEFEKQWNEQFDATKNTASSKDSKWTKAEKMLKEWNEGIARLDNEQKQKCREESLKMSDLHYEATKEVKKNNWVHGICNPPSPDWKKK